MHLLAAVAGAITITLSGATFDVVEKPWMGQQDIMLQAPGSDLSQNVSQTSFWSADVSAAQAEGYTLLVWVEDVPGECRELYYGVQDPVDERVWAVQPVPGDGCGHSPQVTYEHDGWFRIDYVFEDHGIREWKRSYYHLPTGKWGLPQNRYMVFLPAISK